MNFMKTMRKYSFPILTDQRTFHIIFKELEKSEIRINARYCLLRTQKFYSKLFFLCFLPTSDLFLNPLHIESHSNKKHRHIELFDVLLFWHSSRARIADIALLKTFCNPNLHSPFFTVELNQWSTRITFTYHKTTIWWCSPQTDVYSYSLGFVPKQVPQYWPINPRK